MESLTTRDEWTNLVSGEENPGVWLGRVLGSHIMLHHQADHRTGHKRKLVRDTSCFVKGESPLVVNDNSYSGESYGNTSSYNLSTI